MSENSGGKLVQFGIYFGQSRLFGNERNGENANVVTGRSGVTGTWVWTLICRSEGWRDGRDKRSRGDASQPDWLQSRGRPAKMFSRVQRHIRASLPITSLQLCKKNGQQSASIWSASILSSLLSSHHTSVLPSIASSLGLEKIHLFINLSAPPLESLHPSRIDDAEENDNNSKC